MIKPGTQSASVSGTSDNIFDAILDVSDLRSCTIQVSGTFVLSLVVEVSNDEGSQPSVWTPIKAIKVTGIYSLPIGYRFLRVRCSQYTSGTAYLSAVFSQEHPIEPSPATEEKQDPTAKYKLTDYDDSGSAQYFGFTDADGNWYINQLDTSAKTSRFARGSTGYEAAWTDRSLQAYDYYFNTF
jgi:hypothetical protein